MKKSLYLGLDAGSVSVSFCIMNQKKEIVKTGYQFHGGRPVEKLRTMLDTPELQKVTAVSATSSSPDIFKTPVITDSVVAMVHAITHLCPGTRTALSVGGEKFGALFFDENGHYRNYRSNTSCAAGTGSFLDQQAQRLSLSGIEEFSTIAYANTGSVPGIASRCAVFAKTDLIHAQQEGYSLPEICDGLSRGLSINICDTLFPGNRCAAPLLMIGGVSLNQAVVAHLQERLQTEIQIHHHAHIFPAIGAACAAVGSTTVDRPVESPEDIFEIHTSEKEYVHPPLQLQLSDYPDFNGEERYIYTPQTAGSPPIEIDIYTKLSARKYAVFMGIDIGSTSTKASIITEEGTMLAGFYTRTSGKPLAAVQGICEALRSMETEKELHLDFTGVATTGSGRNFIGKIIGADLILDEITAHAKAAHALDPDVDTIIEIGGQDAKFTTLKNGVVTFSAMNSVCAAGTGSFIEELALKLKTPLDAFSNAAEKVMAPLCSDRCTVFMERDLNYYLRDGYSVREVLASVLHSVRENYLTKVASENAIGSKIFFQGATAKNRALVAAFEQRLGVPIMVSRFCHLTGALGCALYLRQIEHKNTGSAFRGLDIYTKKIPVRSEVCGLCTNHCKLKIAEINGETIAYGFLCGRDYNDTHYVKKNDVFDLLQYRQQHLAVRQVDTSLSSTITIGIPAGLHLVEELPVWKKFFQLLHIPYLTSEEYTTPLQDGKTISRAEFCSPMQALHGHVTYLLDHADYVFLPVYLQRQTQNWSVKRQYCYYTQFSTAVTTPKHESKRILSPVIKYVFGDSKVVFILYTELKKIYGTSISLLDVKRAYTEAMKFYHDALHSMRDYFIESISNDRSVSVLLLGRPYTILSRAMNKKIPEIINRHQTRTFYMDMVPTPPGGYSAIEPMLQAVHWHYCAEILKAAYAVSQMNGVYPVLITSFKCTPDVYTIEYVKTIMEAEGKPYLILQLDEHDSSVGYETRIESALRAFHNHHEGLANTESQANQTHLSYPEPVTDISKIKNKTILLPTWDPIAAPLMEANLRREGYDARSLEETDEIIRYSMRYNSGQCIPMNSIAEQVHRYIKKYELDPAQCALWMFHSDIACNVRMYPYYLKEVFEKIGNGFEKITVYIGTISMFDFSLNISLNTYFIYLFAGMIRSMGCKIRPYEQIKGATDRLIHESVNQLSGVFISGGDKEIAINSIIDRFARIKTSGPKKPKVAIFGDIYVRDNDVMNQNLVQTIEENGGEALTTSYSDYLKIIAGPYFKRWLIEGYYSAFASFGFLFNAVKVLEKKYLTHYIDVFGEQLTIINQPEEEILSALNITPSNTGESMDNVLKIYALTQHYDDIALFVQTNPAFCCPSIVTEAMADKIEDFTDVPVVSITYDGTGGGKNSVIIPYIQFA